jgi:hypothetical protein
MFNTKILLTKGYTQTQLDNAVVNMSSVPFDTKYQLLAQKALKAIYESKQFTQEDFDQLYTQGWTQKDVFDVIEHAGTIFKNGRILTAYTQKGS